MKKRKYSKGYVKFVKKSIKLYKVILPCVFVSLLVLGLLVSLIIPLRPKFSEKEKRQLAAFPSFSFSALFDGSFFREIDSWFSDTFPFREAMISANEKLEEMRGFGDRIYGLNNEVVDVPTAPTKGETEQTSAEQTTEEEKEPTVPEQLDEVTQNLSNITIVGNTGYSYWYFNQSVADKYAKTVNKTAQRLSGTSKVYTMLVPTSMDITMSDALRAKMNSGDQKKGMEYIFSSLSSDVAAVDIYKPLRLHRDEYLYYRTDHHWTALGAYYAYEQFAAVKGIKPVALSKFEKKSFGEFLGSYYTNSNSSALKKTPDELIAYMPPYKTTLRYTTTDGTVVDWFLVNDVSSYPISQKYSAFAGADNPYTVIENKSKEKGKTCVIIKESFGNAVIPYIVGNYKKVYVVDYRYYKQGFVSLAKKVKASDVIFINNMSAVCTESLVNRMDAIAV